MSSQLDSVTGKPTDPRSMNRFLYAEGNPWTFSDPSGHATCYSSSDLCDETMAIRHQGTQAAKDAMRRMRSRVNQDYTYARRLHAKARRFESAPPEATPETAVDTWGEDRKIGMASAEGRDATRFRTYSYSGGEDGLAGVVKGVVRGAGDFAVGAVTTPIYALTHLSDAAAGLQCFALNGCLGGAAADLGWDKPVENLGKGWDTFVHMSDEQKASFATGITLTAVTLRGGARGIRGEPAPSVADIAPLDATAQVQAAAKMVAARGVGLTDAQAAALVDNPGLRKAFLGYNLHQEVATILQDTFKYAYRGIDFTQNGTGVKVELTTLGQVDAHLARYRGLARDHVATYTLP